ncbi:LysR family transcriptional regulator [Acinetobacter sp. YH12116]|uniref:LysR family transcriptional regulator n=1 Tax=Acinetobacter sp. YH12116 TaxID=2601103 RepID=UPI0015D1345A|nr:LysR family transcriptional regulator [Acinetobacter sp. YH12116]
MRYKNLDLNLLVALNLFLEEKNVSKAAEKMFITQSTASSALARLRNYFNDELLIQVGKQMELTPRAKKMVEPVKLILMSIDHQIIQPPEFDPYTLEMSFTLCLSDYTLVTFIPVFLQFIKDRGYKINFDFKPQSIDPVKTLESDEADLLIIPSQYLTEKHPHENLYTEEFVCIASKNHPRLKKKKALTLQDLEGEKHIVMKPPQNLDSVESIAIKKMKLKRKVALTTFSFSSIPELISDSEYIAIVHKRLGEKYLQRSDLYLFSLPFDFPLMHQSIQWHRFRNDDLELQFLIKIMNEFSNTLFL